MFHFCAVAKKYHFPTQKEIEHLSRFVMRRKRKETRKLKQEAIRWLTIALRNKLDYEVRWLGMPAIQNPYDMIRMQDMIFNLRPDVIVETGIAHGGSLVFYASLCELLGTGKVIGIDIDIRRHNRKLIEKHPLFRRIALIEGSSIAPNVISRVRSEVGEAKAVLVLLDSNHTHDHVLKELELYSPFVTKGSYIVACDTIVEYMPREYSKKRPWGIGNNPMTAVRAFVKAHKNFIIDNKIEKSLFVTVAPGGFLKRIR